MSRTALAIVGLQWGDEGKGKVVDWLAQKAAHVARFQGGHNAGHTLKHGKKKTILHLLPSGILQPHAHCYIGNGVAVSPAALIEEINALKDSGVDAEGKLSVADNAALILPYHQKLDCARDKKNKIGTTGRGIGPAHEDKAGRRALRLYDLYNGAGKRKLGICVEFYNDLLKRHDEPPSLDVNALWDEMQAQAEALRPYVCGEIGARLAQAQADGERILLEGAQGALLDVEQGTYPFATSASCLAAAAAGGLGVELFPYTVGITKTYCTRVGNGPFPTEDHEAAGERLGEIGEEYGATTGRQRRTGWLDIPMLRHAIRINGCQRLVVTKLDVLDAFDEIKLCTAYEMDGARRDLPPNDTSRLDDCIPQYEKMPGWRGKSTAGATAMDDLPPPAKDYLHRIAELCDTPIAVISTGAEREQTITLEELF